MTASERQHLLELTESLPELSELETGIGGPAVMFDEVEGRPSFGFGVYRDLDMGVMRTYTGKGGKLRAHIHSDEHEWLGVIRGELRIRFLDNDEELVVTPYDVAHIEPGRPHDVTALEDTWGWSVAIPPADGYPDITACPCAAKIPKLC